MKKHTSSTALKKVASVAAALTITAFTLTSCHKDNDGHYKPGIPSNEPGAGVMAAAGDSATIIGTINQFRSVLGSTLNTTPGQTGGRREVNWDAVPPAFTNADNFPFDFFNSTNANDAAGRKRGLIVNNPTGTFRVDSTGFKSIDASYESQFEVFSKKRLFAAIGSNICLANFKVPGTSIDAGVKGFGVIFSDVDTDNSSSIEFFHGNKSLGVFKVPAHPASGKFSFLGVRFSNATITSVKITSGNGSLGKDVKDLSNGGNKDLVVMDDFLYDEPVAL